MFYKQEKLAVFVDGPNFYGAAKGLEFDIDYKKFNSIMVDSGILLRSFYYTAIGAGEEFQPIRPLVDWLEFNGWTMRTKPLKEFTDSQGRRRVKGDMDVDIAVDVMVTAPYVDHIVLCSGDGDFFPLVAAVQRLGRRVTVISSIKGSAAVCADNLRRVADHFMDLAELKQKIMRIDLRAGT